MEMIHQKVRFKGEIYWKHGNVCGGFNISPLHHYSEDGKFLADPFDDISYAITVDENIMRFHKVIGKVSDLEEVK